MMHRRMRFEVMSFLRNDPTLKDRRRELRRDQTDAEKAFWAHVRNRQFYGMRFFRQHALDENREYDAARSEYLSAHGIEVVRFWNNEVLRDIERVLERLTPPGLPLN